MRSLRVTVYVKNKRTLKSSCVKGSMLSDGKQQKKSEACPDRPVFVEPGK